MAQTLLFHGTNEAHEFWQSENGVLLLMRPYCDNCWTAHRDYGFLFVCSTAKEAADRLDAQLSDKQEWVERNGNFHLATTATAES
jgi:hypothetical protein